MSGRPFFLRQLTAMTMLLASLGIGINFARAQQTETENLTLPLGSVFEIVAQEGAPGTQYAWVLSLDRIFLQAGRERVLRTRFSQPGKYFLSAEMVPANAAGGPASPEGGPVGGTSIRRSFVITVKEDLPADAVSTTVATDPPHVSGMITLLETQRLVKIIPPPGALTALTLDADVYFDEDSDGIADNDASSADTFLGSDGLPIFLWITGNPPKTFALTGQQSDGAPFSQQFTASVSESVPAPVPVPDPGEEPAPVTGGIEYTERENGTVHLKIREALPTTTPVLPLWDFGDGTQSLLLEPLHSYGSSGTYIVRVRLKDLRNGIDIRDLRQSIMVKGAPKPTSPETPIPPEDDPNPEPSSGRTSRILILVLKIVLALVIAGVIGAAATFAFSKLRKGKSLADRLEETDKKMVIGKEGVLDGAAVAPMSLPEIIDEAPSKKAAPAPTTPPVAPPTPAPAPNAPIPSWLQQAPAAPKPAPASAPKPAPSAAPAPAPAAAHAPEKPATPAPAASPAPVLSDASMPDWLSPASKKPEPTAPAAAPKPPTPAPIVAPAPRAEVAPKQTPQPTPAPPSSPDGPLPAWLQQNPAPGTPVPAPATTPTPTASLAPVSVTAPPSAPPPSAPAPVPAPAPVAPAPLRFAAAPDANPQTAPASSTPKPEAVPPEKHDGTLPGWLQPTAPKEPGAPKPVAPAPKAPVPVPAQIPVPAPAAPIPVPVATPVSTPIPVKPAPVTPAVPVAPAKPAVVSPPENLQPATSSPMEKVLSDKERERRRLKRQRYRQNKAKREAETAQASPSPQPAATNADEQRPDDAPVAFIRAESIEQKPEPNPQPVTRPSTELRTGNPQPPPTDIAA